MPMRPKISWMLLLPAAFMLISALVRTSGHDWGDDWAQYVNHARNLIEHRPYGDTNYVFNPARPNIGPPSYPPGTAFLLAPVEYFVGVDVAALKLVGIVCLGLTLAVMLVLFTRLTTAWIALLSVFALAVHPKFWVYSQNIQSEPPFFLATFGVMLASALRPSPDRRLAYLGNAVLAGLLLYFSIACRSIGVVTLGAVVLHEVLGGRWRRLWLWVVLAVTGLGMLLQRLSLGSADYSQELAQRSIARVLGNLTGYWDVVGFLYPLPRVLALFTPAVLLGMAAYGVWLYVRREHPAQTRMTFWSFVRTLPLPVWFVLSQFGALIVLPFAPNIRYLIPLLPVLLVFIGLGLSDLLQRLPRQRMAVVAAALAVLVSGYYAALWVHGLRTREGNALCADCMALYDAVRTQTGPDERIAFPKPRALALMARRPSWSWAINRPADETWQEIAAAHIQYVIFVSPEHELADQYPPFLSWEGWRSRPGASLVYENASFRLVRLGGADRVEP